jgi:lysophospholipase L1-like esterase
VKSAAFLIRAIGILAITAQAFAAVPAKSTGKGKSSTPPPQAKHPSKKRYLSSAPKPASKALTPTAKAPAKPAVSAKASTPQARAGIAAAAKLRAEAQETVFRTVADQADLPIENPAGLVPFFEQLYRHQKGEMPGPVRILHYGDSHTAADEWTGELRAQFQERFGDGGSGYSLAGRPYAGYRRMDVRSGSTKGWHTDGLAGRAGDGIYGLGGVSMSAKAPHEQVYLEAAGSSFELFYYQQPGGGALDLFDNGMPVERLSTDGDSGPGYYRLDAVPGPHRFELETVDRNPVRLFGWVAENPTGVTYEELGINGAQASIVLDWNEQALRSNLAHRNPALIVLAYGTNEAGRRDYTLESYRDTFSQILARFRAAAPTATILVLGPPDRLQRTRKGWQPMENLNMIVEAQREAALANGCPFWDLRAKMGGPGSMGKWVSAGMAQPDRVHFTAPGYRLLGGAVFRDLMSQYEIFLKARAEIVAEGAAEKNGN